MAFDGVGGAAIRTLAKENTKDILATAPHIAPFTRFSRNAEFARLLGKPS